MHNQEGLEIKWLQSKGYGHSHVILHLVGDIVGVGMARGIVAVHRF